MADYISSYTGPQIDSLLGKADSLEAVSGTNDGTNWTSLTIGSTTKAIPAGGSSLPSQTGNSGKFLTTDGSDASWANLPSDVFWCNFTLTENNGNTTVTCDKTVSEIATAYNSGKSVIGKVGYFAIPLNMVQGSGTYYIAFVLMSGASYIAIQGTNSTNPDTWIYGTEDLKISDLYDVHITSAANNDVLKYDSAAGRWVNGQVSGGSSTLSGLTDTTISSPTDGQMLKYDNASSKWINANVPTEIPSQTGNSGKFLTTNGSAVSWANLPSEQPDWEQNDSTAADYIKHRTHSKEFVQSDDVGVILDDTFLFQQLDSYHVYYSFNILGNIEADKYYTVTIGINNTDYVTKMAYCCKDGAFFYLSDNLKYKTERTYSKFYIDVYKYQGITQTQIGLVDSAYNLPSTDVNVTVTIKECFFDVNLYDFVNDEDYQVEVMTSTIQNHILMTYSNPVRLVDGNEYKITIDGTSTVCATSRLLGIFTCVGNQSLMSSLVGQSLPDTGEDFLFADSHEDDVVYAVLPDTVNYASHATASEVSVFPYGKNIWQKLDSNYLNTGTLTIKQNGDIVLQTTVLGDGMEVDLPIVTGITHSEVNLGSGNIVTFPASKKCSFYTSVNSDTAINLTVNNSFDNILWINNSGSSEVDITFSSITYMTNTVTNVYMPEDGITIPAGNICEIGIICNSSGAFITSRNDLTL